MPRHTGGRNKPEAMIRFIIFISILAALAGSLLPMFTVHINLMGRTLYSQDIGLLSLLKDHTGGLLERIQSLGLQTPDEVREKIITVIALPASLYLAIMLLVIIVMICTLVNTLGRLKTVLSIAAVAAEVYLISVMRELPNKLIQALNLNNMSGLINWTRFLNIHTGSGIWIMLAALISTGVLSIIHAVIRAK